MTDAPLLLVGTHRSGTTWLADVLSCHRDLVYAGEPRHIWTWPNPNRPDDRLTAKDATPRVKAHIQQRFQELVREGGGSRLFEKTPSNCLRMPFINEIYPNAKILLLIRDGRNVVRSTAEILQGGMRGYLVRRRLLSTPVWQWPGYAPQALQLIRSKVFRRSMSYWGPRPPGWRDWIKNDHRDVVLAKQWAATLSTAIHDTQNMSADRVLRLRFEDVVRDPAAQMQQIIQFAQLEGPEGDKVIGEACRTAQPEAADRWREQLSKETLDRIRPHMEPLLNQLGYEW